MKKLTGKLLLPVVLGIVLGLAAYGLAAAEHEAGVHKGAATVEMAGETAHGVGHEAVAGGHEAGAEASHGEHGEGHHASVTPAKLKDLFWRTVNFIALVIILVKFLAKPIGSGLSSRRKEVAEELQVLEEKRNIAEQKYKEFEAKLSGMEAEMETIVQKAIKQAESEKKRILEEAEKAAGDIKRQAEAAVQAELVDAKRRLREEAAEKAAAMAEELIVKNLTPKDQVAITEQFLERVGAVQ